MSDNTKPGQSFSNNIKQEIINNLTASKYSYPHFLKGLVRFNANFPNSNKLLGVNDLSLVLDIKNCIYKNEKIKTGITIVKNRGVYNILADDLDLINELCESLQQTILKNKYRVVSSFAAGVFLYCGNCADPIKEYHLDFLFDSKKDAVYFHGFLTENKISSGLSYRNKYNTVYIKESESLEDVLTLMGATKTCLSLMNIKIYKQFRNKANRVTNCETANIGKIVDAATREIYDINLLKKVGVFETLSPDLKRTAKARLSNPDMSLNELSLSLGGISRSGVNHRFQKIHTLAEKYY